MKLPGAASWCWRWDRSRTRTSAPRQRIVRELKCKKSNAMKSKHWISGLAVLLMVSVAHAADTAERLSDYVCPFVGAQGEGNTFPGPSAPFGMVQISPD